MSTKGKMIKHLNGYEQIPIINLVADKILENKNAVQVAGLIAGMANIEYNMKGEFPDKPVEVKRQDDYGFAKTSQVIIKRVKNYNNVIEDLDLETTMSSNVKAMDHLYTWADLNNNNDNSRQNWKKLYEGDLKGTIRDEGTLFKEITMTIDLLKQLIIICEIGANASDKDHDYYINLADKLQAALELIQREPADERL